MPPPGKFGPDTQNIHISALPLPDGAARDRTLQALKALLPTTLDSATGGLRVAVVAGTITADIGTTAGLALDATLTSGAQKTQVTVLPAIPAGTNVIGKVDQGTGGVSAWKVDGSAVTQPISASSLPLPTGAATQTTLAAILALLPTSLDGGNLRVKVENTTVAVAGAGASGAAVSGNPVLAAGSDGTNARTLKTGTDGTLKVDGSATTQPVSGTVTANIGTSGSLALDASVTAQNLAQGSTTSGQVGTLVQGAVTTAAPTYTTAKTNPLSLTTTGALRVDGSGVTQPVSGTITANIGTSGSLALDASVTGLQVSQGSTTSGQKGGLTLGAVTTAAPTYTTAQSSPLSLTTAGALRVDGSGATQPVSGTVTANIGTTNGLALDATLTGGTQKAINRGGAKGATTAADITSTANGSDHQGLDVQIQNSSLAVAQSGTWTVQPGNTANTTAWLFAGGKTHNNAAPGATNIGVLSGIANAAAPVVTEGNQVSLSTNLAGSLRTIATNIQSRTTFNNNGQELDLDIQGQQTFSLSINAASTFVGTITPGATVNGVANGSGVVFYDPATGLTSTSLTTASGTAYFRLIIGAAGCDQVYILSSGFVSGTCTVVLTGSTAGFATVGFGKTGNAAPPYATQIGGTDGTNLRTVKTTTDGGLTFGGVATGGGTSLTEGVAAASNNATSLKASAGQVYGYRVFNAAAYPVYLKFYNKASAPSPGSDTPVWVVGVAAGQAASDTFDIPLTFGTGVAYAVVKGISNTDNTSLVASDCVWAIQYV